MTDINHSKTCDVIARLNGVGTKHIRRCTVANCSAGPFLLLQDNKTSYSKECNESRRSEVFLHFSRLPREVGHSTTQHLSQEVLGILDSISQLEFRRRFATPQEHFHFTNAEYREVKLVALKLPGEMCEGFVGLGHSVRCFLLGDGASLSFVRSSYFRKKAFVHRLPFCAFGSFYYPAHAECELSLRIDLTRNLVVGAADASAPDFHVGGCFIERFIENDDWVAFLFQFIHHLIHDLARGIFLATLHDVVDELRNLERAVHVVGLWLLSIFYWSSHDLLFSPQHFHPCSSSVWFRIYILFVTACLVLM